MFSTQVDSIMTSILLGIRVQNNLILTRSFHLGPVIFKTLPMEVDGKTEVTPLKYDDFVGLVSEVNVTIPLVQPLILPLSSQNSFVKSRQELVPQQLVLS